MTVDGVTESFVQDPWSPYSSIANDVLLDFEDGALVRRWLHGPEVDEPLAYERYAGTTAGGSGTALELFRNRLGSVILAVSVSTGAVAAEYDYDSFGQRTLVQGTEEVRYGFTSREHDARTGLIHYRARAYDPLTGQFLQRDPIGFASGDLNLYAYVENDPYNFTDPSGLTASGQYGNLARGAAQMARGAIGNIGRGVLSLANGIRNALTTQAGRYATAAAIDRVTGCVSAVGAAMAGDAVGGATGARDCARGGGSARAISDAVVRPADSQYYSVAAEVQLPSSAYPGLSRPRHNQISNQALHDMFQTDPAYAAQMESLYPGIVAGAAPGSRGAFSRNPPASGVTWHHGTQPGQMQLVPTDQHGLRGPIQGSLHPNGSGGFADWGTQ
ncbi:MAG: HNH endonuclease [Roseicyclus sp.]|nr:HNH endonuclease [Roseicyclus sp.]MBO6924273.1 HNH endonuclease [Roseicyclus sp.]